jgi:hypothetical protein
MALCLKSLNREIVGIVRAIVSFDAFELGLSAGDKLLLKHIVVIYARWMNR